MKNFVITNFDLARVFPEVSKIPTFECDNIGLSNSNLPNTLSLLKSKSFARDINENDNITAVITSRDLSRLLDSAKTSIVLEDPEFCFWSFFNSRASMQEYAATKIDDSAHVHQRSFVAESGVQIGKNTVVGPNVTILEGVSIGDNCIIRSGTVLGFDGFEHKRTNSGMISVIHDGKVVIEDNVEIGALNSIAKGFSWQDTIVGAGTKTDSMVHIAHCVSIGRNCLLTACSEVSGSVHMGDDCWLGPNCSIMNGITIGKSAIIGLGSVVTKSVSSGCTVAGNPARLRTHSQ